MRFLKALAFALVGVIVTFIALYVVGIFFAGSIYLFGEFWGMIFAIGLGIFVMLFLYEIAD